MSPQDLGLEYENKYMYFHKQVRIFIFNNSYKISVLSIYTCSYDATSNRQPWTWIIWYITLWWQETVNTHIQVYIPNQRELWVTSSEFEMNNAPYCTYRARENIMGTAAKKETFTYTRVVKLHLTPWSISYKYSHIKHCVVMWSGWSNQCPQCFPRLSFFLFLRHYPEFLSNLQTSPHTTHTHITKCICIVI